MSNSARGSSALVGAGLAQVGGVRQTPRLVLPVGCIRAALISGVLAWLLYGLRAESSFGLDILVLVWAGLFMGMLPGMLWLDGSRRSVPIFEAICASYAVQDIAPALLLPNTFQSIFGTGSFTEGELSSALLAVIVGLIVMQGAYWLCRYGPFGRPVPDLNLALDEQRLAWYLPLAVIIGGLLLTAKVLGHVPPDNSPAAAIMRVVMNQFSVAVAILTYRRLGAVPSGNASRESLLLVLSCVWAIGLGLVSTMVEQILTIPVIIATIGIQRRRRAVWGILALGAVGYLLVLQPLKFSIRSAPASHSESVSPVSYVQEWIDVASFQISRLVSDSSPETVLQTSRQSLQRLDFVHVLLQVRSQTPSVIPFFEGSSYSYLVTGWIPRLVWPDKPTAQREGVELVLTYGLTTPRVLQSTTMAVGTVAEAYANFGDGGILAFMLIQGAILGWACRILGGTGSVAGQAVLLSVLVVFLNGINTNTAALYGGVAQNLVANALLVWVLAGWRGRTYAAEGERSARTSSGDHREDPVERRTTRGTQVANLL